MVQGREKEYAHEPVWQWLIMVALRTPLSGGLGTEKETQTKLYLRPPARSSSQQLAAARSHGPEANEHRERHGPDSGNKIKRHIGEGGDMTTC